MTLSAQPVHYEQASALGSTYDAMRDVWWWINGTHPTEANSIPWPCIEADDGTTREQPTDGDMTNLSSGSLWKPGVSVSTLPLGAWAVFRNPGGGVAATFQIYVKMESFTEASVSLVSLDDWATGGASTTTPTLPTTILTGNVYGNQTTFIWAVNLDEGMFIMRMIPTAGISGNSRHTYAGEVNTWNTEGDDPRPFIISVSGSQLNINSTAQHRRISPVDSSTVILITNQIYRTNTQTTATTYEDLSAEYLSNVCVYSTTTVGHRFVMGMLRNVGTIDVAALTQRATCGIDGSDFRFEVWSVSAAAPSMVTLWPPGTSLANGHTIITEESIPPELQPAAGGGGDTTAPVVTYVDPLPGAQIRTNSTITIDVTDDSGGFGNIQLRVRYEVSDPQLPTETIYGGDKLGEFEAFYESSTIALIADGFRFVLTRDESWPSTPTFIASPIDSSGNIT